MAVYITLLDFWSNFLYGIILSQGDTIYDTAVGYTLTTTGDMQPNLDTALGHSFYDFMNYFNIYLPHILTIATILLAIFLFGLMMYKIIKLFTNAF